MVSIAPTGSATPERVPQAKALPFEVPLAARGAEIIGAFREILNRNTDSESYCAGGTYCIVSVKHTRKDDADGHSFGDIMQRYGKHQHKVFSHCGGAAFRAGRNSYADAESGCPTAA